MLLRLNNQPKIQSHQPNLKTAYSETDKTLGMDNEQTWVEALNISPESLSEWSSLAPAGKPLLVWCLEQGHISADAYFAWAQERFQLPVLDSTYFNTSFERSVLESQQNLAEWAPWFFPVGKWDDVYFVACVEPPHEDLGPNYRFVLADPVALGQAWGSGLAAEAPTGMDLGESAPFKLNLEGAGLVTEAPPLDERGTTLTRSVHIGEHTQQFPPLPDDDGPPPITQVRNLSAVPTPPEEPDASTMTSATTISQVPEESVIATRPSFNIPGAKPAEAPKLNLGDNELKAINTAFDHLNAVYENSLVMTISESSAKLYRWDAKIRPIANLAQTTVDLAFPTFLRIVNKTLLPYHGYLVDSPAHREFFGALGRPELPGCVTAVPLKVDTMLWGVLVCIGSDKLHSTANLAKVEAVAEELVQAIGSQWKTKVS